MKKKTLWLTAVLWIGTLLLAGCNSWTETSNQQEQNVWIANPASVYCEENGGTLVLEDGSWLCMFEDESYCEEWSYQRWECQPGDIYYNTIDENDYIVDEEENIDVILPEWAKTSLTNEELEEIIDTHFPKGYTYSTYNMDENLTVDEWDYTYPEDLSHTLLIPEHATMASRTILSSGIEDGMIYTDTEVTLQDDTVIKVLYIVNPVTLDFVAATSENGNFSTNYQFTY